MVEKKKDPAKVVLKDVRLSYPAIWKAKAFGGRDGEGQGEPKFSAVGIMDPSTKIGKVNIAKLEAAIDHVKAQTWPKGAPKFAPQKVCLKDSEDLEEMKDGYEDMMYVSASSSKKPAVYDIDGVAVTEGDEGAPYAGCQVDMIVRVWGQDNKYGKRINASLEGIKFRDDGEAFGAGPTTADDFDDDDDDTPPPKKRRAADEDEPPKKRRPADEDEDERPARKRRPADEDEEEERPARKRRPVDEDEEEERPARKRRPVDEDEEEERPARKRRPVDEDEEDEPPRRRR